LKSRTIGTLPTETSKPGRESVYIFITTENSLYTRDHRWERDADSKDSSGASCCLLTESAPFHLHSDLKDRRVVTRHRASGHKDALRRHDSNKCYGLVVQVSVKDCERKAINANLCLVVAALSVIGAHQRTIELFISIILISLSVLDWSIARRECQRFG
jgi:hypothetical protein